jgi:RNA polymerase sigma factor (sigma-70 family)
MMYDTDSFGQILNAAGRIPLLTPEEEIHLSRMVQSMHALKSKKPTGPYTSKERRCLSNGKRARDRMITANLRLVASVVRRYIRVMPKLGLTFEDMMQDGIIGLTRGVEKFDPERGYKLSTYVYWWIRQGITRGINATGRCIRLPVHIAELGFRSSNVVNQLRQQLGREPTVAEVAETLKVSEEEYRRFLLIGNSTSSLDAAINEEGGHIADLISDGETNDDQLEKVSDTINQERVMTAINDRLNERQRLVVMHHFGIGTSAKTLTEISELCGVSRERCRQLLKASIYILQREMLLSKQVEDPLHQPWTLAAAA